MRPALDTSRIQHAYNILENCTLCPRHCRINRNAAEKGFCGIGQEIVISSSGPHFGEEPPLVGRHGSGTIFISGCNLQCIFCQNYEISHFMEGKTYSIEDLVKIMLNLEAIGCHNINFVTPTHVTPQLMDTIHRARKKGLTLPIVYNCGGYESADTLKLLEGFIDIYMPDAKYGEKRLAEELSAANNYFEILKPALKEMQRQVGDLVIENGLATRGLLVRHLVMPGYTAASKKVIDFIAEEISPDTYINIMDQYYPRFRANRHARINQRITLQEFQEIYDYARQKGLRISD